MLYVRWLFLSGTPTLLHALQVPREFSMIMCYPVRYFKTYTLTTLDLLKLCFCPFRCFLCSLLPLPVSVLHVLASAVLLGVSLFAVS